MYKGNPQTGEAAHNLVVCCSWSSGSLAHGSKGDTCAAMEVSLQPCHQPPPPEPAACVGLAWASTAPLTDQHCTMGLLRAPLPAALVPAAAGPVCGRNLCTATLKGCLSPAGADLEWVRWHQHCLKPAVFQRITQRLPVCNTGHFLLSQYKAMTVVFAPG